MLYVVKIKMYKVDLDKEEVYTYFIPTTNHKRIKDKLEKLLHESIKELTEDLTENFNNTETEILDLIDKLPEQPDPLISGLEQARKKQKRKK